MVDLDEQLRSYASWLAEQADREAGEPVRTRTVPLGPHSPAQPNRRRWWPIAAVAAVSALVLGLLTIVGTRDAQAPADQPSSPTVAVPPAETTTIAPTTTSVVQEATITPEWAPSGMDGVVVRPLAALADGDVVVPAYVPDGMVFDGPAYKLGGEFDFALTDDLRELTFWVRQWAAADSYISLDNASDDPDHPPVEVDGITWRWFDFESARVARIGAFEVTVGVYGFDEAAIVRFIEGLRSADLGQFPDPVLFDTADGGSVVDDDGWSAALDEFAKDQASP